MKRATLFALCVVLGLAGGRVFSQDYPKPADNFYEKYPVYKEFFPFGAWGGAENNGYFSRNIHYMGEDRGFQFVLEGVRENYMNCLWGRVFTTKLDKDTGRYTASDKSLMKNEWLKKLDIYAASTFWKWFAAKKGHGEVLKELKGKNKWLTNKELDRIIEKHRPKFEAMSTLHKELGDRLIAIMPDDEPLSVLKSYLSIQRGLKRFVPGLPVVTVTNEFIRTEPFLPYVESICSESYGRHKWNTRDFFLKYYRISPETVVWNDILTGSYGTEPTLPGIPDSRPTNGEVRLAFWQSVAGGAKGFFCYIWRMFPTWWKGDKSFCNQLGREVKNNNLSVMREVARDLTAIGPLLLSCYPVEDEIKQIAFQTGSVNYLQFKGAVLDCGVLKDKKNKALRYVIVYNNNIDATEKGAMTVPEAWLAGSQLFDLHTLKEVPTAGGKATFPIAALLPGGGRIYLVADRSGFKACKRRILTHRIRNELIRLDIRVREITPLPKRGFDKTFANILEGQAKVHRSIDERTTDVEKIYGELLDLIAKADKILNTGHLGQCNKLFRAMEDAVCELDEIIECHSQELFGVEPWKLTWFERHNPKNKQMFFQYRELIVNYFAAKNMYWRGVAGYAGVVGSGLNGGHLLLRLENYAREGRELVAAYKKTVQEALNKQRRPVKVLFLTPDRNDLEFFDTYAWLYKNFPATYGRVKPDGRIVDLQGKPQAIEDCDVLWLHAVRSNNTLPKNGAKVTDVLQPVFLKKPFIDKVKEHLGKGKSLMLTGLFAMYVDPLGLEKALPDLVQDQASPTMPMLRGFAPCPGFAKHPVFRSYNAAAPVAGTKNYSKLQHCWPRGKGTELRFDPEGFYTSGHHQKLGYFAECTWKNADLKGRVIADVYDSTLGTLGGYAGIVEYGGGSQAKVLVAGSMSFDLSPGHSFYPTFRESSKGFIRALVYNMICYLGGKETFEMDRAAARTKRAKKDIHLLPATWKFQLDPDNKGVEEGWFKKDCDDSKWKDIEIGASWESRGYDYNGYAWYRINFKVPEGLKGKKVILYFAAVDEIGYVYLDGTYLGKGGASPEEDKMGWATPFHFDITDKITDFARAYQLTVRVHDSFAAGGIWKPVYFLEKE